jgi:hypothetical protein
VDHPSDIIWVTGEDTGLLKDTGWRPAPLPASKGGGSGTNTSAAASSATNTLKQRGNALFLRGNCIDALHTYLKALATVKDMQRARPSNSRSAPEPDDLCRLQVDLLNNCAAACLALHVAEGAALAAAYAGRAAKVAQAAGDIQRVQKALLREAKALLAMHRYAQTITHQQCLPLFLSLLSCTA